ADGVRDLFRSFGGEPQVVQPAGPVAQPRPERGVGRGRRHQPDRAATGPDEVDIASERVDAPAGLSATQEAGEEAQAILEVGHTVDDLLQLGVAPRARGWKPPRRRAGKLSVRLGDLHDDARDLAGMQEELLPLRELGVDADRPVAGPFDGGDRVVNVLDLEGDVMRARSVAVEEPAEEVVALDPGRLQHLDAHPAAVGQLVVGEPRPGPATEEPTW